MPVHVSVHVNSTFKEYIRRYQYEVPLIMGATLSGLILSMQRKAIVLSREALTKEVYAAALPASAEGDSAYYLEVKKRRSGAVWHAIKRKEIERIDANTYSGKVWVDDGATGSNGYYYAMILEYGGRAINYTARPFWRVTEVKMRAEARKLGAIALTYTKGRLKGQTAGGSAILEVV